MTRTTGSDGGLPRPPVAPDDQQGVDRAGSDARDVASTDGDGDGQSHASHSSSALGSPMQIGDPLPHEYITRDPGIGGVIKRRPEDFLVDEIPLYEPSGEGEHLYACVQKRHTSHAEMMSVLRRHFDVEHSAIGFAGMKDKMGITRQIVSIHLPGREPPAHAVQHDRIQILWSARHLNKLRMGHLAGNRFSIRMREVDPMHAPRALRILRQLQTSGVPNYFGGQRFGFRSVNHTLGALVLRGEWRSACDVLMGPVAPFPEHQRSKRELYAARRFQEMAALWTTADRNEHIVAKKLARGVRPRDAVLGVGQAAIEFWTSALQSAIFNRVLDQRIRAGRYAALIEGDVAWKHDNRASFAVTVAEIASGELPARLLSMEISPTGPLWGSGMMPASGEIAEIEGTALTAAGFEIEQYMGLKRCPPGQRRPMRVPLENAQVDSGLDEHGEFIRVAFDLPRGSYATVVMREITKDEQGAGEETE